MGPYDPPQIIRTKLFATMPEKYAKSGAQPGKVAQYYARFALGVVPGPNGLVLSPDEKTLYVGSRTNTIWWQPLRHTHPPFRTGNFAVMTGSGTPDGMAIDAEGNVVCVQTNMGVVWVFNKIGLPLYRIETCTSDKLTNIAYGGPDNKTMFILDGHGKILTAQMPVPGLRMYSHM
jgi:gluconolactonase